MITEGLKGRDFLRLQDFTKEEIDTMLDVALQLKADNTMRRRHDDILPMRTLFMMFFNPSLRTRNSFEAGIFQLGGHGHFLQPDAVRLPTLEGEDVGLWLRAYLGYGPCAFPHGRLPRHSHPGRQSRLGI